MMNNNITNHFIKRLTGILLILCLSFGVLAGCGKGKKPDENSDHAEAADSTASDTDTEPADADEVKDSREEQAENISGIEVLHSVISSKGIRVARPGDSASCSDVEWDTVCLSDEDAAKYPQLAKALAAYSQEQDEAAELFSNDGKNQALDYLDGIKEELAENGQLTDDWYYDLTEWPYYIDFEYRSLLNIIRCDEIAFTLQEDYYDYEGGTHGYYACSGTNFDTQTGQKLKVEDVVKDMDADFNDPFDPDPHYSAFALIKHSQWNDLLGDLEEWADFKSLGGFITLDAPADVVMTLEVTYG